MLALLRLVQNWKHIWVTLNLFLFQLCKNPERSTHFVMDPDLSGSSTVKPERRSQWDGEVLHPTLLLIREWQREYQHFRQSRKPMLHFQHLFHGIIATNQK